MDSLTSSILNIIQINDSINTLQISDQLSIDHQQVVGIIKSLGNQANFINYTQIEDKKWKLTEEGRSFIEQGSHEANIYRQIPDNGIEMNKLMASFDNCSNAKLGFSKAMSFKWISVDKTGSIEKIIKIVPSIIDQVQLDLIKIDNNHYSQLSDQVKKDLKKRKLIEEVLIKSYKICKGTNFNLTIEKYETDLTTSMLIKNNWMDKKFKDYNFKAKGIPPDRGHLHPLLKVREQFRQIFLEMGFSEMPTNNFVESSFWNFDALFQPQQHPARDSHDTFFISDPQLCENLPEDYLELVKKVHSEGGFGSQGYKYDWKLNEAKKNILRTHTTSVSARMLYKVAQNCKKNNEPFKGLKYFSIDRVFRNENLDATHLAEFHQIEGVVADIGLTLGNLMGIISQFFEKMGIKKLRFKPAYNPYTEPSMEIFSFHEGLKKWVEVGNSGIFRPEMLLPMDLPSDVTVIAWGLSLERPTMIKYKIDDIRKLVGHKVDLQVVYNNPICILNSNNYKN